ncbi:MAG TPA: acetyl-CoA C-acetyltransferase [Candidatus Manganitrophaceae bacterium]|nr:acetyl-CoA C-acetyltransferase [Candidatus Manganitrophaceae bacterium]
MRKVVIISAVRTPIGSFQGRLSPLSATELGSRAIAEAVCRAGIEPGQVEEVLMGNVLSAGLGQAPARQAAIGAGLPVSVPCVTINKVCGSGLKSVMMGAQAIALGDAETAIAGGMESMSRAPYLLERARSGYRLGHGTLVDSLIKDGLWDVYNDFHMGSAAEACAERYHLSRSEMDDFAIESYRRAQEAQRRGDFKREIVPVEIPERKGTALFSEDEEPKRVDFSSAPDLWGEKLRKLKPAFAPEGKVTAGNASSLSDGAAAVVLMSEAQARKTGLTPRAEIIGYTTTATEPALFTTAPAAAIGSLLKKFRLSPPEIDLFEINEAFAASSIAVIRELGIDPKKVNPRGGAIALGHPIGASGTRILTTLIHLLEDNDFSRGVASLCIGGGEAVALLIQRTRP